MKNTVLVLCLVMMLTSLLSEAKPHCGKGTDRCCNDCKPCRVSFNIEKPAKQECSHSKNYSYNVQHIKPHCPEEKYETWNAHVEKPKNAASGEKLKLSAKVEYKARDCDCPTCRYGNSSTIANNKKANAEHHCTNKSSHQKLEQNKFYEFSSHVNSNREEVVFSQCFTRKRRKRAALDAIQVKCDDLVKQGYICRCVPDNGTGCFNTTEDGEPIVGSIFRPNLFNEPEVYLGGGKPPSYNVIRQHISPILVANEGRSAIQEAKEIAELYYEIYQRQNEKNLTIPIKYGTRKAETEESGLRTYDIEPVEGQYEPSPFDMLNTVGNQVLGGFMDRVRQGPQLPRLFPLRSQSNRAQRNAKRKQRKTRAKT